MDALNFIDQQGKARRQPFYVLSGDEDFLKRQVLAALVPMVIGATDPEYAVTNFPGDKTEFSTVRNELDSVSFFSERRLVIVELADPFVTKFRAQLEDYAAKPSEVGVLVLDVKAFPATTKLAKALPDAAQIVCKAPSEERMASWCTSWCQARYGKKLAASAAELLVEYVGAAMGVLDQELHKLTDYVGARPVIEPRDIEELTGKSRGADVFKIMNAVGAGERAQALQILGTLLDEGEAPVGILAAMAAQLRKLAKAARLHKQGMNVDEALTKVGIPTWPKIRDAARAQMRHLGLSRLDKIYDWLVETDSGIKGGNPLSERMQLERLVVRLARPRA